MLIFGRKKVINVVWRLVAYRSLLIPSFTSLILFFTRSSNYHLRSNKLLIKYAIINVHFFYDRESNAQ